MQIQIKYYALYQTHKSSQSLFLLKQEHTMENKEMWFVIFLKSWEIENQQTAKCGLQGSGTQCLWKQSGQRGLDSVKLSTICARRF